MSGPPHDDRGSQPEAPANVVTTTSDIIPQTADTNRQPLRIWRPGCPCGCSTVEDCRAGQPIAASAPWCCLSLGWDELEAARRNGWNCQRACVAERLGVVA